MSHLGDQAYHRANALLAQTVINNQTRLSRVRLYKALVLKYIKYGWDGELIQTFKSRFRLARELHGGKTFKHTRENEKFADLEKAGLIGLDANGNVFVVVDGLASLPKKPSVQPPKQASNLSIRTGQGTGPGTGHLTGPGTGRPYGTPYLTNEKHDDYIIFNDDELESR